MARRRKKSTRKTRRHHTNKVAKKQIANVIRTLHSVKKKV